MFKKTVALLLAVVMLLSALPTMALSVGAAATLYDTMVEGLQRRDESIVVGKFEASRQVVEDTFQAIIFERPELFYVRRAYTPFYDLSDGHVTAIRPTYAEGMQGGTLAAARRQYQAWLDYILSFVQEDWSDLQKVLFLHDYLGARYEYDQGEKIYDAYNLLTQGTGVCQAYMLLFNALLNQAGIETSWAHSVEMEHVWSLVKLDGEWYHVDVTWDDPVPPDLTGRVFHDYFLVSDAVMAERGRTWKSLYKCTSKKYDADAVWTKVKVPFACLDGTWYYIETVKDNTLPQGMENALYTYDFKSATSQKVKVLPYCWKAEGGKNWLGFYSGLGAYDGKLYFNTPDALCSYAPATDTLTELWHKEDSGREIYGSFLNVDETDVELRYMLRSKPNSLKEGDPEEKRAVYTLHEHVWGEGVVTTEPACEKEGVRTFTCEVCGEKKTETLPAFTHSWGEGTVTTEPACEKEGERVFTCEYCGEQKTESIPALFHLWSEWKTLPDSKIEQRVCSLCGKTQERAGILYGDANGDGEVTTADARLILQYAAEIVAANTVDMVAADVSGEGDVTTADARAILQYCAEIIDHFPAEEAA